MTDLKTRLAVLLASPEGKAMVEEGLKFSTEALEGAFAQVLAEADDLQRVVVEAALHVLMRERQTEMTEASTPSAKGASFLAILASCGTMLSVYGCGTLRQMTAQHAALKCDELICLRSRTI
jgi:hypothetical protein